RHGLCPVPAAGELLLQHVLREESRSEPLECQRSRMDGPLAPGARQLRNPADRLPRSVRVRLAADRERLPDADRVRPAAQTARGRSATRSATRLTRLPARHSAAPPAATELI